MARVDADLVRESSTSTGTGSFTVTGAATGEQTFASRCSVGDTFDYCIRAVDGSGVPTGEWEVGEGSYSASNTITRNTVYASSNGDALVNFSAGSKQVSLVFAAKRGAMVVERLTAARTYYVRTDGSDANNGLANSSDGAFLTIQKAIDTAAALNNNGFDITINVVAGTYTGANTFKPFVGSGKIIIQGASLDLTSTLISTTSADCFTSQYGHRGVYQLQYMKLQTTTGGAGINCAGASRTLFGNLSFGAIVTNQIWAQNGAVIECIANYTISGGGGRHFFSSGTGSSILFTSSVTVTLTGTPAFSNQFALANVGGWMLVHTITFSGSATGTRYIAQYSAFIYTNGGGASYLPGNVAGSTNNGGAYY